MESRKRIKNLRVQKIDTSSPLKKSDIKIDENINICLNCKEKKCKGTCEYFKR